MKDRQTKKGYGRSSLALLGEGSIKLPLHCLEPVLELLVLVFEINVLSESVLDDFVPFVLALGQTLLEYCDFVFHL